MHKVTRRKFLAHTAAAAVACKLAADLHATSLAVEAGPTPAPVWPTVVVSEGTNADSAAVILKTALDGLGGLGRFIKPGQTVAIKCNATWDYPPGTASSTDPELLRALVLMAREVGARRIIVMDHCSIDPGTAQCLLVSGIGKVLDELGVEQVFPDRYQAPKKVYTDIELPHGKAFQQVGVIAAAVEADVRINMAVAKSHLVTKLTMVLKHMMGFLEFPGALHAQLEQGIADISTASRVQAQLHLLEAIRVRLPVGNRLQAGGTETDLTDPKRVKRMNQIVVGTDPVLMDAYGCIAYFDRQPEELAHVKRAYEDGLGEIDVLAARAASRLVTLKAGQVTPTPTATMTVTAMRTATAGPLTPTLRPTETSTPTATGPAPTNTPLPTATPAPSEVPTAIEAAAAPVAGGEAGTGGGAVVNPNSFLSGALIPAAAVVTGLGLVLRRRLQRGEQEPTEEKQGE